MAGQAGAAPFNQEVERLLAAQNLSNPLIERKRMKISLIVSRRFQSITFPTIPRTWLFYFRQHTTYIYPKCKKKIKIYLENWRFQLESWVNKVCGSSQGMYLDFPSFRFLTKLPDLRGGPWLRKVVLQIDLCVLVYVSGIRTIAVSSTWYFAEWQSTNWKDHFASSIFW